MSYEADCRAILDRNQGLPGKWFTDQSIFDLEQRLLFETSWMCIGLSIDVPGTGDMLPVTVFDFPLLLVREAAQLHVFHNVCSHRGAELVSAGARKGSRIVCPYHSWAYTLSGELIATPSVGGAGKHSCEGLNRGHLGLRSVRTAEWAGHVFVNLSGTAPEFADWIRPVDQRLNDVDWAKLRRDPALAGGVDVAANWKLICENFVESYHLPAVHRELNRVNPMETHYQILGGHSFLGQGGTQFEADHLMGGVLPRTGCKKPSRYDSLNIFPNLIIAPLVDVTFSIIVLPQSPGRTRERIEFFFGGDEAMLERFAAARRKHADFTMSVNNEDIRIVESVQHGRHSPAFSGGQFYDPQEATSLQFQKMIAARILADGGKRPEDIVALETRDIAHAIA